MVLFSSVPIAQAISLCFARKPERNGKQGSQECNHVCADPRDNLRSRGQELLQEHPSKKLLQRMSSEVFPASLRHNMWL